MFNSNFNIHISYLYDCIYIDSIVLRIPCNNKIYRINDSKCEFGLTLKKLKYSEGTYIIKNENLYCINKEHNSFIEHRHDQSVFSLLSKKYNIFNTGLDQECIKIFRNRTGISKLNN